MGRAAQQGGDRIDDRLVTLLAENAASGRPCALATVVRTGVAHVGAPRRQGRDHRRRRAARVDRRQLLGRARAPRGARGDERRLAEAGTHPARCGTARDTQRRRAHRGDDMPERRDTRHLHRPACSPSRCLWSSGRALPRGRSSSSAASSASGHAASIPAPHARTSRRGPVLDSLDLSSLTARRTAGSWSRPWATTTTTRLQAALTLVSRRRAGRQRAPLASGDGHPEEAGRIGEQRARVRAPAGARRAGAQEEIALQALAEVVALRHERMTANPLRAPEALAGFAVDPVCGMTVDTKDAATHRNHDGRRISSAARDAGSSSSLTRLGTSEPPPAEWPRQGRRASSSRPALRDGWGSRSSCYRCRQAAPRDSPRRSVRLGARRGGARPRRARR